MAKSQSYLAKGKTAQHGRGLTARTRAAILKAMDVLDDTSKGPNTPVHLLLAGAARKDIFKFMDMSSKYIIKDINTDADSQRDLDNLSNQELAEIVATHARKQRAALQDEQAEHDQATSVIKSIA